MNFVITVYRNNASGNMPVLHFNADSLVEAQRKVDKASTITFANKIELSVILSTWIPQKKG